MYRLTFRGKTYKLNSSAVTLLLLAYITTLVCAMGVMYVAADIVTGYPILTILSYIATFGTVTANGTEYALIKNKFFRTWLGRLIFIGSIVVVIIHKVL